MLVVQHPSDAYISIDDNLIVRNLRLNLVPSKGLRIKGDISKDGKDFISKDLSVYKYDMGLSIKGFHINLQGNELKSNTPISLKVQYEITKKHWLITGSIGNKSINKSEVSIINAFMVIVAMI